MLSNLSTVVQETLRGTPQKVVPLAVIGGSITELSVGLVMANNDTDMAQIAQSVLEQHEKNGFQLRIDARGDGRYRLCCSMHTRKHQYEPKEDVKARERGTKRHSFCSYAISIRRRVIQSQVRISAKLVS